MRGSDMRWILTTVLALGLLVGALGCAPDADVRVEGADEDDALAEDEPPREEEQGEGADDGEAAGTTGDPHIVDITAVEHTLRGPDEIPSGWAEVRLHNHTTATHFALFGLLPEGRSVEDSERDVVPVFQEAMDLISAGDPDAGFAALGDLPAWLEDLTYLGGPGFVAPSETATTIMYLEPGTYAVECYVKTRNGEFHTTHGMISEITVTDEEHDASPPEADAEVSVSSEDGIVVHDELRAGEQVIAVHFEDQVVHEHGLGHDVHLARLDDDTDLEQLGAWMSWITGLDEPAPVAFVGGAQSMPAGSTAYLLVDLEPGDYAFVAELPEPEEKGMLQVVSVSGG